MLLSLEIKNWKQCKFSSINIDSNIISLHGSCFCGKTTILNSILYVKSIVIDQKFDLVNSEIILKFNTQKHIYKYRLRTDESNINEKLFRDDVLCFDKRFQKKSFITIDKFPDVYAWFNNIIFIRPFFDESFLNEKMTNLNDSYFSMYEKYIYPNSPCYTLFRYWKELTKSYLTIGRNGRAIKYDICNLSFSLKEFLYYLPIIHTFLTSNDKILFVDDIEEIAHGLIKNILSEEYVNYENVLKGKQLIVFTSKSKNVFLKGKVYKLDSFI